MFAKSLHRTSNHIDKSAQVKWRSTTDPLGILIGFDNSTLSVNGYDLIGRFRRIKAVHIIRRKHSKLALVQIRFAEKLKDISISLFFIICLHRVYRLGDNNTYSYSY